MPRNQKRRKGILNEGSTPHRLTAPWCSWRWAMRCPRGRQPGGGRRVSQAKVSSARRLRTHSRCSSHLIARRFSNSFLQLDMHSEIINFFIKLQSHNKQKQGLMDANSENQAFLTLTTEKDNMQLSKYRHHGYKRQLQAQHYQGGAFPLIVTLDHNVSNISDNNRKFE